jgi:hypothetical protein
MNDGTNPTGFRHAVLAVSLAVFGGGMPTSLRSASQRLAGRVMRMLDARRAKLDPDMR